MVNVHTGQYDKEAAKIRKGYHRSKLGEIKNYNPFHQPNRSSTKRSIVVPRSGTTTYTPTVWC